MGKLIVLLALTSLAACSSTRPPTPPDATRAGASTAEVVGVKPVMNQPAITGDAAALDAINEKIVQASLYCGRGKKRHPDSSKEKGADVKTNCDDLFVNGTTLVMNLADFVEFNRWDSNVLVEKKRRMDQSVDALKELSSDKTAAANDWSKVGIALVDVGFRIWNGWKDRQAAERKGLADHIRAKKFPKYDDIPLEESKPQ